MDIKIRVASVLGLMFIISLFVIGSWSFMNGVNALISLSDPVADAMRIVLFGQLMMGFASFIGLGVILTSLSRSIRDVRARCNPISPRDSILQSAV